MLMSAVSDFLPLLQAQKYIEFSSVSSAVCDKYGGAHSRVSSPFPGRSIFSTSAPRSANICAAKGPAKTRDKSMTLRPWSAGKCVMQSLHPYARAKIELSPSLTPVFVCHGTDTEAVAFEKTTDCRSGTEQRIFKFC